MKKTLYQLTAVLALGTTSILNHTATQASGSEDSVDGVKSQGHVVAVGGSSARSSDAVPSDEPCSATELESRASSILKELQAQYPFDPKKDLGEDFEAHLKGDPERPWSSHLTSHVQDEFAILKGKAKAGDLGMADVDFRSVLMGMDGQLGSTWPDYKNDTNLGLKMTVEAARQSYAPAIHNLGRRYKEGIGGLAQDQEKGNALMAFALAIVDPSVARLEADLRWEKGEDYDAQ